MEPRTYALVALLLTIVFLRKLLKPKANLIVSGILTVTTLILFIVSNTNLLQLIGFSILMVGYLIFFYYRYKRLTL